MFCFVLNYHCGRLLIILYPCLLFFLIIFKAKRLINFDEIGISFSGSKNGIGGRPGAVMITEDVNEAGTPQHKTSQRVSTIYGMNFAFEALPPFHVIQSTAENPRIEERFNNEQMRCIT